MAFDVITVPPLKERLEDILPLAYAFAINMASEMKQEYFAGFTAKASSALLRRDWPGNVRELKNAIERSVYRQASQDSQIDEIAFDPFDSPFKLRTPATRTEARPAVDSDTKEILLPTNFHARIQNHEQNLLLSALRKARFNQRVAADLLGLSYHQIRGKIRKYKLDRS
jgi:psp operon transcriptional activator